MPSPQRPAASSHRRGFLGRDGSVLATFSLIPSPTVIELIAIAGFDVVIIDTEHGPFGIESVGPLVLAAQARGIASVVRVRTAEPALIGAALDAGADGVLVPQISSAAEAAAAVAAARFAPEGARGANPYVRAADYDGTADWYAEANSHVAVMVMVEGRAGVEALPAVVATPSLDAVFVGPVDLSHALGVPGETDHPLVVSQVEAIIEKARRAGVATGVFAPTPEAGRRWVALGVDLVAVGVDSTLALHGFQAAVAAIQH